MRKLSAFSKRMTLLSLRFIVVLSEKMDPVYISSTYLDYGELVIFYDISGFQRGRFLQIISETVEKSQICIFGACKLLISLHAKLLKSPFWDFFDSLSINLKSGDIWFSVMIS
jgi:hypothetical protein